MYLKCEIKGKQFPMHLRVKAGNCRVDVFYSSNVFEPNDKNHNMHYILSKEKVIKIN